MQHTASKQIEMQKTWEELHAQNRFCPKYPNELVVRWALTQFPIKQNTKILDLGCGAGRHAIFLAQEGFDVYATDISREGINVTQNRAQELGLHIQTKTNPAHLMDYSENFFDGIVCYAVLYYGSKEQMETAIKKSFQSLKPGGKMFLVTRGNQDWRCRYGQKISSFEYHLTDLGNGTPADSEKNMVQTFLTKNELIDLYKDFRKVTIETNHLSWSNGQFIDHDFLVFAEK